MWKHLSHACELVEGIAVNPIPLPTPDWAAELIGVAHYMVSAGMSDEEVVASLRQLAPVQLPEIIYLAA